MANREARLILWESEQVVLHNEAFGTLAAARVPAKISKDHVLGRPFATALPHLWDQLSPMVDLALYEGQSSSVTQMKLTLFRNGMYIVHHSLPVAYNRQVTQKIRKPLLRASCVRLAASIVQTAHDILVTYVLID